MRESQSMLCDAHLVDIVTPRSLSTAVASRDVAIRAQAKRRDSVVLSVAGLAPYILRVTDRFRRAAACDYVHPAQDAPSRTRPPLKGTGLEEGRPRQSVSSREHSESAMFARAE